MSADTIWEADCKATTCLRVTHLLHENSEGATVSIHVTTTVLGAGQGPPS